MSLSLDKNDIIEKISKVSSLTELESLRVNYLGKKGLLTAEMKSLPTLSIEEKKEKGQKLNIIKIKFKIHPYSYDTIKIAILTTFIYVIFLNLKLTFEPVISIAVKSTLILILYTLAAYIFKLSNDVNIFFDKFNKNW